MYPRMENTTHAQKMLVGGGRGLGREGLLIPGESVAERNEDGVPHAVVGEPVVGGEAEVAPAAAAQGEDDLEGGGLPHVHVQQLVPGRGEQETQAKTRSLQGEPTDAERKGIKRKGYIEMVQSMRKMCR